MRDALSSGRQSGYFRRDPLAMKLRDLPLP
jgi:hypothetical protein